VKDGNNKMPSKSKAQHNLMAAVANNPSFAKKVGIKKSVGEEFLQADKGKKFKGGGMMDKKDMMQDKKTVKKAVGMHEKQLHGGKKSDLAALKKGGRIASKGEHAVQKHSKRGAEMVKMKSGGMAKCAKGGGIEVRGKTKGKIC
jgi:hypothetical protein